MAKKISTPEARSAIAKAPHKKNAKPKALEVESPSISSELEGVVEPSRMEGSYLTVDPRMDGGPITVHFSTKERPGPTFEDILDDSDEPGARNIHIPLVYLTTAMGFTLLVSYEGTSQGQPAASRVKEFGVSFYPASESEDLAPRLLHEKIVHNTPTYDMHDHAGDETVLVPVPLLAKKGDKVYCTAVTEQDAIPYTFYTVVYGHVLTEEEAVAGHVLKFFIARGWLARRKPWRSITLQSAWITSGLAAEPPADIDPHLETRLPANALEIQRRRTAALIVDHGLDLLPPHLRQSVQYNGGWCLNPELTKAGGNVDVPGFDSYADDVVCFHVSGPGFGTKPLGCVTIEQDGDLASIELSACDIACFFGKTMTLGYTVQFPNSEGSQPSPEQSVNVSVPQLPHSDIEEATQGTVDLVTFSGNATALVPVWSYAECSNRCWMWLIGKRAEGGTSRFDILTSEPVTDEWKNKGVEAFVLRAELQKLDDCSVFELHFAAGFCDTTDLAGAHEFPVQTFEIEQEPLVLLAPKVTEAVGSDLTAYNGRNGVHVEVNYVGNDPRHSISVCWKKPDGTCWPLASKPGSNTASVVFTLPAEAVIESMGKTVPITYTVTTACKLQTSLPLNLDITLPVRLETPNVLEATPPRTQNAVLDLRAFAGNANSLEDPMWFLRAGQKCWLYATGTGVNGSPYTFTVYAGRAITATEATAGVAGPVLRTELSKLRSNSSLTLTFKVTPDGSLNESNAVVCPPRVLTVRLPLDDFTTFSGNNWNGWLPGPASLGEMRYASYFGKPCVANGTASTAAVGNVLYKDFTGLLVGATYEFSILACTYNGAAPLPRLSLRAGTGAVTAVTTFYYMAWTPLKGTFVANATSMRLEIWSHESTGISGNDYAITDIRVRG
ncbi:hypothetical protein HX792_21845 [Pseudomonas sp. B6002]|uniref:hypothetical protein n=1 Tax=Pseudomonas sp. B6002 TaxID=2726978 RepID=UPI0015A38581|nr:hypothetical protein [Pseudomonas sp. B6002]NVZ53000.1 hypothetical protein [Pseudomonas sp. B6002]